MSSSLVSAAVKNPLFQENAKKAAFQSVMGEDEENQVAAHLKDGSMLDVDEAELKLLQKWSRILRVTMLCIATSMMIISWYNVAYSSQVSTMFLAVYLFFFSIIICCFELGLKFSANYLAQNFGFLYNNVGRSVFLAFVALLCYELSTWGKVLFAFILAYGCVVVGVTIKHPQYGKYLKTLHFYNRVKPRKTMMQKMFETVEE